MALTYPTFIKDTAWGYTESVGTYVPDTWVLDDYLFYGPLKDTESEGVIYNLPIGWSIDNYALCLPSGLYNFHWYVLCISDELMPDLVMTAAAWPTLTLLNPNNIEESPNTAWTTPVFPAAWGSEYVAEASLDGTVSLSSDGTCKLQFGLQALNTGNPITGTADVYQTLFVTKLDS